MLMAQAGWTQMQQPQNYTGNGGKGISLTIYVPQSTGLAQDQSYIPALVQGELVSNFSKYSAISILDWERLDDIYVKLVNEAYDDNAEAKQDVVLGRLAPTSHFLTGNITKTATGYNLKINITKTADKMTVATYSGTFSFAELDNLTGVRRASLELLQNVGVTLTEKATLELTGTAEASQISAQTALAKGITAQRAGTEVTALSYYYQAAIFNPALKEAVKRSTVTAANISSGNIGADLRNDILWRKKWIEKLKETEEAVSEMISMIMSNVSDPPFTFVYLTDIKMSNVNYDTETADFSITMGMYDNGAWFAAAEKTLAAAWQLTSAVSDGLEATKRKEEWKLGGWPVKGVSDKNPFAAGTGKKYEFTIVLELVDQQGRVIGKQEVKASPVFYINSYTNGQFEVQSAGNLPYIGTFKDVKANDISDKLTIRVASVNGMSPQQARLAIASKTSISEKSPPLIDVRDGKTYNTVKIGGKTWMAENLNYLLSEGEGNSWCCNCDGYDRLYSWDTAIDICPAGWHLPSPDEWSHLEEWTGAALEKRTDDNAYKKLKSRWGWPRNRYGENNNGTDDYGFSARPYGYTGASSSGCFEKENGYWWTSSLRNSEHAYFRVYGLTSSFSSSGDADWRGGRSVRCVAYDPPPIITPSSTDGGPLVDNRDGKTYKTIVIGGQRWMAENMNFQTPNGSWCYGNNNSNCNKSGRLYNWKTAKTVCPKGWHLPTRQEWGDLVVIAGGIGTYGDSGNVAGTMLKATNGWYPRPGYRGMDAIGFSALPGGIRFENGGFYNEQGRGEWWTATDSGAKYAYDRAMDDDVGNVYDLLSVKDRAYSVRCREDVR